MKHDIEYCDKETILKITEKQAYEWVKTGVWNFKTFKIWFDHVISNAEDNAIYYQNLWSWPIYLEPLYY